jgi:uncharacterized damage-inducible protein DinB
MMLPVTQAENSVLKVLFDHNTWANLKLLDCCAALSEEQLAATVPGTYGSIRDTLHHLIGAEVSYVARVNGKLPDVALSRDQFPGFAVLKQVARWTGDELLALALAAQADSLVEETEPPVVIRYPLASLMMQAINHSTEHRTHVSTIITQLGLEPPDMTGWGYMEDKGEFQETTEAES